MKKVVEFLTANPVQYLATVGRAEGADAGLVTLHGGQVVCTSRLQKFAYFFHKRYLRLFDCLTHHDFSYMIQLKVSLVK